MQGLDWLGSLLLLLFFLFSITLGTLVWQKLHLKRIDHCTMWQLCIRCTLSGGSYNCDIIILISFIFVSSQTILTSFEWIGKFISRQKEKKKKSATNELFVCFVSGCNSNPWLQYEENVFCFLPFSGFSLRSAFVQLMLHSICIDLCLFKKKISSILY